MATFGDTTAGPNNEGCTTDRALVDQFTLSEAGDVTSMHFYCGAYASSTTSYKGVILADDGGEPGDVLGVSAAVLITSTGWFSAALSLSLAAGTYWLGLVANNFTANVGSDASGVGEDIRVANGNFSYSSPPAAWPTSGDFYTVARQLNVYATYTPTPTPQTLFAASVF